VKVVFHPQFLSATSPLFNLDYDQFVRGCHLGVFPSYYEPWGYTPLECLALGIPTVTSDLAGFGDFAKSNIARINESSDRNFPIKEGGIHVLRRSGVSADRSVDELADFLFKFVQLNRRERIELRNRAERLGEEFDWARLAGFYHNAHAAALKRLGLPG